MHAASPLISVLLVLLAALISASILIRLKQPTIVGFIIAGALIGPHGFGLVPYENVELLAELGIGLLMFTIGVELSIQQLLRVKYISVIGGSLLIAFTTIIALCGMKIFGWSRPDAILWGFTTGFSSTVVVLKLLAERGEIGSTQGNVSTGILLYQDIISVPLLVLLPIIAGPSESGVSIFEIFSLLGKFILYLLSLYAVARFLVPKFLRFVANTHSKELFSISILCISLGIAGITHEIGLSLALGAFLAGLVVSESDFGNQAAHEVLPLKDSFSAIFFVSIGMLLDMGYLAHNVLPLTAGFTFIFCIKFLLIFIIMLIFRYQVKISVFVGLALAQMGEFGFLLLLTAKTKNLISNEAYQLILGIAIVSIIATPYQLKLLPYIRSIFAGLNKTNWISRGNTPLASYYDENKVTSGEDGLQSHVILCGFGPTGSIVMKKLYDLGFSVVVVDLNYRVVQSLKKNKQHAIYGDSSSLIVLEAAGISTASMIVVTIPDPLAMQNLVKKVKTLRSDLPVIMRVKYMSDRDKLLSLGADDVVWEEYEAGQELARRVMSRMAINSQS